MLKSIRDGYILQFIDYHINFNWFYNLCCGSFHLSNLFYFVICYVKIYIFHLHPSPNFPASSWNIINHSTLTKYVCTQLSGVLSLPIVHHHTNSPKDSPLVFSQQKKTISSKYNCLCHLKVVWFISISISVMNDESYYGII